MRWNVRVLFGLACLLSIAGCERRLSAAMPPAPAAVAPDVVCIEQINTDVTLTGQAFSPVPVNDLTEQTFLDLPTIDLLRNETIDGMAAMSMPDVVIPDDPMMPMTSHVHWTSQQSMMFSVTPDLMIATGLYDIRVTDRSGFDQNGVRRTDRPDASGTLAGQLLAVPRPMLTSVEPDFICTDDHVNMVTLHGDFFLMIGSMKPTVTIQTTGGMAHMYTPSAMGDCRALPGPSGTMACRTATVTIPMGDLAPGEYGVSLTNPSPAGCHTTETVHLTVLAAPTITGISQTNVCDDITAPTTITITGTGFIFYTDAMGMHAPTVAIGPSMTYTASPVSSTCTAVTGPTEMVQTCTQITFTIPAGMYPDGDQTIVVTNPPPADCHAMAMARLRFVPRPTVSGVTPTHICAGGGTLAITGTGFVTSTATGTEPYNGSTAELTGGGMSYPATTNMVNSSTSMSSTWGSGVPLSPPSYDLTVSNGPGCDATLPGVVTVITGPQIFFADPPVVYSGITTQVTLYVSGISNTVRTVTLTPSGGGTAIPITMFTYNALRPNRMQIVVPMGIPDGDYDISLTDDSACGAILPMGLHVTSALTVSVTQVDPPFAWTGAASAVTISGAATPPTGEVGFMPVPRMYLNPVGATASTIATPLEAVTLSTSSRASALVPQGLPVGLYDLIVVNPDGSVGFLDARVDALGVMQTGGALEVTTDPAPTISTSSPGSVPASTGQTTTVQGANFRTPTVTLRCEAPGATTPTNVTTTVSNITATSVDAAFDASVLAAGTICVVRVINADGTYGDWSAISVTTPSLNIGAPRAAPALATARRAPAAGAVAATAAARFVYAIGGDSGMISGAMSSVESMPIDPFGNATPFVAQRYALGTARTFAGGAVIDRFLYAVGGSDGTNPLASVERAYVLDPADRTVISDLEIQVTTAGTGLMPGLYYYQVAPIMGATDPYNPGGENLPSEEFPVILPTLTGHGTRLAITWNMVAGATGYRIYRSPNPGDAAGMERLIHEVSGAATITYTDNGDTVDMTAPLPLALGSTGVWSTVATLGTARLGAAVTVMADPDQTTNPGAYYIYAAGGRGAANLTSIEIIPVTLNAANHQETVGAVRTATGALTTGRWAAGAFGAYHDLDPRVAAAAPWVYIAGGVTSAPGAAATTDGTVNVFPMAAGGDLGANQVGLGNMTPAHGGFGAVSANNLLYAFGGQGGLASTGVISSEICGTGHPCTGGLPDPPDLVNWNNAGISLVAARVYMGVAVLPGFIFLVGGADAGGAALTSTELTNW